MKYSRGALGASQRHTPEESMEERFDNRFEGYDMNHEGELSAAASRVLKEFIRSYGDERERKAEERIEELLGRLLLKHTSYDERPNSSPYEQGVVDGHRCAMDTAMSVFTTKLTELS